MKVRLYMLIGLLLSLLLGVVPFAPNLTNAAIPISVAAVPKLSISQGVEKMVLDNGLTLLTKEIHTAPVVSVQVWYKVGSRNEGQGESGISHQLEHLLFKGTKDRPVQFGRLSLFYHFGERKMNVGWVERSETQQYRSPWVLGFVPQPNLRLN